MAESLDGLADAFRETEQRPAVFDREIRTRVGQWDLPQSVPASDVLPVFRNHPDFVCEDGSVHVPLHRPESATLTGEFLRYAPDHVVPCVVFYDFSAGGFARIPLAAFDDTYPAWRLRFFHPDYEAPHGHRFSASDTTVAPATGGTTPVDAASPASSGDGDGDEVIRALELMVAEQEVAEREETRARCRTMTPSRFIDARGGIPEAVTAGIEADNYGQQVVTLRVPTDRLEQEPGDSGTSATTGDITASFGIYPGSEVIVDSHDGHQGFPAEAEVLSTAGRDLSLSFYWDRGPDNPDLSVFELETGNRFLVAELLNPVPFERKREAVGIVAADDRKRGWLTGTTSVGFDAAREPSVPTARLNTSQYRAAYRALCATDVCCIHGPPGTGKTRTLVEVVRTACEAGERVLATAHSNQAVDNLLVGDSTPERTDPASLHRVVEDSALTAARVGTNTSNDLVAETYGTADPYEADVVCATTSGAHRFGENIFDCVVVDEATQASIPATLVPVARAKRAVLVGDHRQLPPYHSTETSDEEEMAVSLFEHLLECYGEDIATTLQTQYRMHEAIAAFPNAAFYDGALDHGEKNRSWTIPGLDPLEAVHVAGEEAQRPTNSYYNEAEAAVVAAEATRLFEAGVAAADVGIITPYVAQIGKIRAALQDQATPAGTDLDAVKVATVDSFQGSEREAIVVSFVRSNPQGFSGFLTFPAEGPRRLNVALTRARRRCVLVGNFDTLGRRAPTKDPAESCADVYQGLYDHLRARELLRQASGR